MQVTEKSLFPQTEKEKVRLRQFRFRYREQKNPSSPKQIKRKSDYRSSDSDAGN
jgi:hypothetical protein